MKEVLIWSAVFASAAVYETLTILWVHYFERSQTVKACLYSGAMGTVGAVGLYFSLSDALRMLALIPGYMLGTAIGIWIKRAQAKPEAELEPEICTREFRHVGPCNGFPRPNGCLVLYKDGWPLGY